MLFLPYNYLKLIFENYNVYYTFLCISALYCVMYPIYNKVLELYSKKYIEYTYNKKTYIVTNILKSNVLFLLAYLFISSLLLGDINLFNTELWLNNKKLLINFSGIYTVTDFVALFVNKSMNMDTIFHHICVVLAYLYLCNVDYKEEGIHKSIIIYGGFSSLAALVNLYLGLRHLEITRRSGIFLKFLAFLSYLFVCTLNWLWQGYYLMKLIQINIQNSESIYNYKGIVIYILIIYFWIKDDINLMKFLGNCK